MKCIYVGYLFSKKYNQRLKELHIKLWRGKLYMVYCAFYLEVVNYYEGYTEIKGIL